jgi:hypothetical protein
VADASGSAAGQLHGGRAALPLSTAPGVSSWAAGANCLTLTVEAVPLHMLITPTTAGPVEPV